MLFDRTYRCKSNLSSEAIKEKLIGKKIKIHQLDFEILEKDNKLKVIPHAENAEGLKTLPITHLDILSGNNQSSFVKMHAKPRRIDVGGPYMLVIFCILIISCAVGLYFFQPNQGMMVPAIMLGIGLFVFIIFWFKMQAGYFDYIRKIRSYVKQNIN